MATTGPGQKPDKPPPTPEDEKGGIVSSSNGTLQRYGFAGTVAVAILAALSSGFQWARDTPTRSEMVEYTNRHTPWVRAEEGVRQRISALEATGASNRQELSAMTRAVVRLEVQLEAANEQLTALREEIRKRDAWGTPP